MREERELHFANQLKGGVYFSPGEFCVDIKGEPVLYFKLIQRTKCLIESTSIRRITAQQSQSRVIHTSPDKKKKKEKRIDL